MSYPDVKPLVTSLGLPPNKEGLPYTLPIITHNSIKSNPNGAMMDSLPIIKHLDQISPAKPLFPSGDASYALFLAVGKILTLLYPSLLPLIMPRVPEHLDARGQVYFHETRTVWFGKPLAEVFPTDRETVEGMYQAMEKEAGALVEMLNGREGKKGPFFEGEVPGYADLLVACHLAFFERFDKELFGRLLALGEGEIKKLYQACLPWLDGQGTDKEWAANGVKSIE